MNKKSLMLGACVAAAFPLAAQTATNLETAASQIEAASEAVVQAPLLITADHTFVKAFPGLEATEPNENGTQFVMRPLVLNGEETTRALRVSFVDEEGTPWAFVDQSTIEVLQGTRMRVVRLDAEGVVLSDSQLEEGNWDTTFYMNGKPVPNQAERQAGPIHFHPMEYVTLARMAVDGLAPGEFEGKPALVSGPDAQQPVTVTYSGGDTFAMESMTVGTAAMGESVRRYSDHVEVLPGVAPLPTDIYNHETNDSGVMRSINQFQNVTYTVLEPAEFDAMLSVPVEDLVAEASTREGSVGE